MRRTLLALTTAVGLTFFAVVAAFAWQARIEGQPANFNAGGTSGVYFWHSTDDGLHLRTTDPEGKEHWFTGEITTDGTIRDLDPSLLEPWQGDYARVEGNNTIVFGFHTFSGIDGINYFIDGGTYQTVDVQRDGTQLSTDRIFLGQDSQNPENNPFKICRDGSHCPS